MNISSPSHTRASANAGGRLNGRPHGDSDPRSGDREPDMFPSRLSVARGLHLAHKPDERR